MPGQSFREECEARLESSSEDRKLNLKLEKAKKGAKIDFKSAAETEQAEPNGGNKIHTQIHTKHAHTRTDTHTNAHTNRRTNTHTTIHTQIHTTIHTQIHTQIDAQIDAQIHTHTSPTS